MKKIKEINLNVSNDKDRLGNSFVFNDYAGNMLTTADSAFSRRMQIVLEEDEEEEEDMKNKDDIILELCYSTCRNSYALSEVSNHALATGDTPVIHINEGVVSAAGETAKAYLSDLLKNALSTGAIIISSGAAGDTVVDILYAVKRAGEAAKTFQDIMAGAGILKDFFNDIVDIPLENNINQIKDVALRAVIKLGKLSDDHDISLTDKISGSAIEKTYKKASDYVKKVIQKVLSYINKLKDQFIDFIKKMSGTLGDWIGAFIPDDFGLGSAAFKGILNDVINTGLEKGFGIIMEYIQPALNSAGEFGRAVLSESKLNELIPVMIDEVFEMLESPKAMAGSALLSILLPGIGSLASGVFASGAVLKKLGFIDAESTKQLVPGAVKIYGISIKLLISFLAVMEATFDGSLEKMIEQYEGGEKSLADKLAGLEDDKISGIKDNPDALIDLGSELSNKDLRDTRGFVDAAASKLVAENLLLGMELLYEDIEDTRELEILTLEEELDEDVDEAITMASGNISGRIAPIGRENHGSIYSEKKDAINEQRERIALLQAYHQKTTNRLK